MIAELQSDCLTGLDFRGLGGVVQKVPILCDGFLDNQGRTGVNPFNQDGALRVGGEIAVAITHDSTIALRDKELHIGQRLVGLAVDFLNEQAALRAVAKIQFHHILVLTTDVGSLGCGVDDMAAVTGQLLYDVGASLQASDRERAVYTGLIGPDDRSAGTRGAAQVFDLEHRV